MSGSCFDEKDHRLNTNRGFVGVFFVVFSRRAVLSLKISEQMLVFADFSQGVVVEQTAPVENLPQLPVS